MIIAHIKEAGRYKKLSPAMDKALAYIESEGWKDLPIDKKRYPIHEGEVEAMRMIYETKENGAWETHQNWTDIQMIVSGEEHILYAPASLLELEGGYLAEKDFQGYSPQGKAVEVLHAVPGLLYFFFPEDGHQPNLWAGGSSAVEKVVVKVKEKF